jgi:hypothetical protein
MKMMSSTSITSMKGVTLISCASTRSSEPSSMRPAIALLCCLDHPQAARGPVHVAGNQSLHVREESPTSAR